MKIAFLTFEYPSGGGYGTYVEHLALNLARKGHKVLVISQRRKYSAQRPASEKGVDAWYFSECDVPILRNLAYELKSNFAVNAAYKRFKFDVLHVNVPQGISVPVFLKAARRVATVHGLLRELVKAVSRSFGSNDVEEDLQVLFSPLLFALEKSYVMRNDYFIAVSQWTKRALQAHYNVPSDKISVVPAGVDTKKFRRVERAKEKLKSALGLRCDGKLVLFVGRFHGVKNPLLLVSLVPRLLEEEKELLFVFVGQGAKLRRKAEAALRAVPRRNYAFLDFVPHDVLPLLYSAADALVLTSVYENCPLVALEAMSCGTVVVAPKVGGVPEVVSHMESGLLYRANDREELFKCLLSVLRKEVDVEGMGERARKIAVEKYDWSVVASRVEDVFQKVASGDA